MAEYTESLKTQKIAAPDYAYSYKMEEQETLMKKAGIVGTYREIFIAICKYVTSVNDKNAQIDVDRLYTYLYEKGNIPGFVIKENAVTHTNRLLQQLLDPDVDLISIKEVDGGGKPTIIILKNKGEILLTEVYRKALEILNKNIKDVVRDRAEFLDIPELARILKVDFDYLKENLTLNVEVDGLTEKTLLDYRRYEKLITIDIDEQRHIVIAPSDVHSLVHILVDKIRTFYEDPSNDNLRSLIFRGFREKNIDIKKIPDILTGESISDRYFLFFTQLFINIMKNYSKTMKGADFQQKKNNVHNQYVAARVLSILSMSRRKSDRKEKLEGEKAESDRLLLVKKLIEAKQYGTQGQLEFYPVTIPQIAGFKAPINTEDGGSSGTTTFGTLYKDDKIREMIKYENGLSKNEIPNIVSFNFEDEVYYIHRSRIIRAFFTAKDVEADRIVNRVRNEWMKYPERIIKPGHSSEFYELIENKYISEYFQIFLDVAKRILAVDAPQDSYISILQDRLFLSSEYVSSMGVDANTLLVDVNNEPLDKNKILKSFIETIYREGTFEQRSLYQVLGIEFEDVYDYVIENLNMGFIPNILLTIKRIFGFFSSFFSGRISNSSKSVFEGKKNVGKGGKVLEGAKRFGKKLVDMSQQFVDDGEQASTKKGNVKKKTKKIKGALTTKQNVKTNKQKRQQELDSLKKIAPLCKDSKNLEIIMNKEHSRWNNVMGDAGKNLREDVDNMIRDIVKRFSVEAFSEKNADRLADDIVANNKGLGKISNQSALKKYIYYVSLLAKLDHYK